ncbi:hypothetical protein [Alkalimonas amylolytica]|uniref:Lipoprotein n=1 Tax=Alkalimonas amylolytica TaxID=152573 RepID=A0A1H4E5G2_ALKAM|nr:hypothetical protein [Alkalimonas amylolytica]SEA80251.1 hypothetical protein SAMN04488051_106228 [Alkalimonas amylolytica]
MIKIIILTVTLMMQGCTVVGAVLDNELDRKTSTPRENMHDSGPFSEMGMEADVALFQTLRQKIRGKPKQPEMECEHDGYFRVCRVLDDESEY